MGKKIVENKNSKTLFYEENRVRFIYLTAVVIFLIPLIISMSINHLNEQFYMILGTDVYIDLFMYYKVQVLRFSAIILFMGAIICRYLDNMNFKLDKFQIGLILFMTFVVISYFVSPEKNVSLYGDYERHEGLLTWISYIMISYSVYSFVKTKKDIKILITAFLISATIISIIGTFQAFGMDFFRTAMGADLALGKYSGTYNMSYAFDVGWVYVTLLNPNYVGSFISLTLPLTYYMFTEEKNKYIKVILIVSAILQILTLFGSKSSMGFLALIISIFTVMVIKVWYNYRKSKKIAFIYVVIALVLTIAIIITPTFSYQFNKIKSSIETLKTPIYTPYIDVGLDGKELIITLENGKNFVLKPNGYELTVVDTSGNIVEKIINNDKEEFQFKEDIYKIKVDYYVQGDRAGRIEVIGSNIENDITRTIELHLVYQNIFSSKLIPILESNINVKTKNVFKNDNAFSGRGYIWNRTIPIIMDSPIIGHGPDSFSIIFPHIDLIGNSSTGVHARNMKPHNFYLQMLVNFGFLGSGIFFAIYLVSIYKLRKSLLFVPLLGFLVVSIGNDSVVFVTYMIFTLFAIAFKYEEVSE